MLTSPSTKCVESFVRIVLEDRIFQPVNSRSGNA
jgi:hypothetical protein